MCSVTSRMYCMALELSFQTVKGMAWCNDTYQTVMDAPACWHMGYTLVCCISIRTRSHGLIKTHS